MWTPIVVDANGFLDGLGDVDGIRYVRVGGEAR
jgi:hypothetical protein